MRLFLGFDLPLETKKLIHEYLLPAQHSIKGWENPHDYHQTLLFIGEASPEETEVIKERLKNFKFSPFILTPKDIQFFNRRIMYLSFEHSEELLRLREKVLETFPEWHDPSQKPFVPHVTVKRWQRYEYEDLIKILERPFVMTPFSVDSLSLFKAEKDELNRKYHIISKKLFTP